MLPFDDSPAAVFAEAGPVVTAIAFGISLLFTMGLLFLGRWLGRQRDRELAAQAEVPLDSKIEQAAQLSSELRLLNSEIQYEFEAQLAETQRLKTEADDSKAIASLSEEARHATALLVASQMTKVLSRNARGDRLFQVALAVGGAIVGFIGTLLFQAISGS